MFVKSPFCNTLLAKTTIWKSRTLKFRFRIDKRMTWKQAPKTNLKHFEPQKTDINKSQNHSTINQNPVIYNLESILLLTWSSRMIHRCLPRCSRVAKIASKGAPEVPKWAPECQKGSTKPTKSQSREAKRGRRQKASPLRSSCKALGNT